MQRLSPLSMPAWSRGAALAAAVALAGCTTSAGQTVAPQPAPRPAAEAARNYASFAEWRGAFRARALAAGISPATFDRAFAGVEPNARVLELDAYQPEFTRPIWEYLDSAVSDTRVATGRQKAEGNRALLSGIEARYGVDYPVALAIWGIESNYGGQFRRYPGRREHGDAGL